MERNAEFPIGNIKADDIAENDNMKDSSTTPGFEETSATDTPAHRLPWPNSKKKRNSNKSENFSTGHNSTENENHSDTASSDSENLYPKPFKQILSSKIEALVLKENVEVSGFVLHLKNP